MQVNVTNETTTTTTTATITPIPTTTTTIEQDLNKEEKTNETEEQKKEIVKETDDQQKTKDEKEHIVKPEEEEDITASFTIIAPSTATKTRPSSLIVTATTSTSKELLGLSGEEEEVSATFVMPQRKESRTPTPTTETVETTLVVKPILKDNSPTRESIEIVDKKSNKYLEEDGNDKYLKSSTHNKENENHENKKTEPPPLADVDDADTTIATTETTTAANLKMSPSQRAQSSERIRTAFFNPLPLVTQNTTATTNTNANTTNSTTTTPTLDSPVRLRDKRSLFDMDNASSQTLADKLRSEANKYTYDEKRIGIFPAELAALHDSSVERDNSRSPQLGGVGGNSRRSLDSSSLPNSPLHTRDRESGATSAGSDTSSNTSTAAAGVGGGSSLNSNILAAERRPSWRLKFDSGSKV